MPLLRSSSSLLHIYWPTHLTTNAHFPPSPSPISLHLRKDVVSSHPQPNPLLSLPFHAQPLRCFSTPSMAAEPSSSTSQLEDSLLYSKAYWVSESIIAWSVDVGDGSCYLFRSKTAALSITDDDGVRGQDVKIKLEEDSYGLPPNVIEKFPHIRDYRAFKVPPGEDPKPLLKCQLAVATFNSNGKCTNATGLQLPGVPDELFSYSGSVGAVYSSETVSLFLWALTAQAVKACIYKEPSGGDPLERVQLEEINGVWSTKGPKSWEGCYFVYEILVYHPSTLKVEKCYANDPYARGYAGCFFKRTVHENS